MATKVGSGLPGFGDSEGAKPRAFRRWNGEFKAEIAEVTQQSGKKSGTVNVALKTTLLGGPEQADGTDPEGQEVTWFLNVDPSLESDDGRKFTVDALKQVFIAAGVKVVSDEPPYAKLQGKVIAIQAWESKPNEKGDTFQRWTAVALKDSKHFAGDED
jgi:hypothetical protein